MKTGILLIAAAALGAPLFAADSGIPRVPLREAVMLGENFLRTNKADLSRYRSSDIRLDRHPDGQHYWDVRWRSTAATNEFILLRVEMDRKVSLLVPSRTTSALQAVFERAIGANGADFAEFEGVLVTNPLAVSVLKSNLNHRDPIGRLLAKYALLWHEGGGQEFAETLEYFDSSEKRARVTPRGSPAPIGVANSLSEAHGNRVAEFLAVRLVKNPDWPRWKAYGVILYLQQQKVSSTAHALIRFAAETQDRDLRKAAVEAVFECAVGATGADFAGIERILFTNSLAVTVLKSNLNHPDPIGRLLAKYALLWQEGGEKEFTEMLEYLGSRGERFRETPARYPRSDGVANTLSENHGSRVAEFLAVGLVKNPDWPVWEADAVILYLGKQKVSATTDALIRFAAETEDRNLRQEAVKTIRHMADPELRAKLRAERNRWLGKGKELPRELVEMETEL